MDITKDNRNSEPSAAKIKYLGDDQFDAQNYQAALKLYTDAIALCADREIYLFKRSTCYMKLLNYKMALKDALAVVKLTPYYEEAYLRIVKCYVLLGDTTPGVDEVLKVIASKYPKNPTLKIEYGNIQKLKEFEKSAQLSYEKECFEDVVSILNKALEIAPAATRFRLMKAECLAHLGECDDAVDIAADVLSSDPSSAEATFVSGLCLYYTNLLEQAIAHFESALKLDMNHKKSTTMLEKTKQLLAAQENGKRLLKSGKLHKVRHVYTSALKIDKRNKKTNSKILYKRALVNSIIGSVTEAISDSTEILESNSKHLKALMLRAGCYNDLSKFEECVADYESILKIQQVPGIEKLLRDAKCSLHNSRI